jgi:hypothetical protein
MSRPTDDAKDNFTQADSFIARAGLKLLGTKPPAGEEARHQAELDMWRGLWLTNKGLIDLSTGLRATYILLEEVRRELSRTRRGT